MKKFTALRRRLTAPELLKQYQAGHRDFTSVDLSGVSLAASDLSGINLHGADLRGTNLRRANLHGACLTEALLGTRSSARVLMQCLEVGLGILTGIPLASIAANCAGVLVGMNANVPVAARLSMLLAAIATPLLIWRLRLGVVLTAEATFLLIGSAIIIGEGGGLSGLAMAMFAYLITVSSVTTSVVAIAVAAIGSTARVAICLVEVLGSIFLIIFVRPERTSATQKTIGICIGVTIAGLQFVMSILMHRLALAGSPHAAWLRPIMLRFSSAFGTSLVAANLKDADLTAAWVAGADFRATQLVRTRFGTARGLARAHFGQTRLESIAMQHLVTTGKGSGADFSGQVLSGISLQGAELVGAKLEAVALDEADLAGADLQSANLAHADLRGACLRNTKLDGIKLAGARIDRNTYERSGWDAAKVAWLHELGVEIIDLDTFPEVVQDALLGEHEGLTLGFSNRISALDHALLTSIIVAVLGKDTACRVISLNEDKVHGTATVRLWAAKRADLEQVAEALFRRVWEDDQQVHQSESSSAASTALVKFDSALHNEFIIRGLADMTERLVSMSLRTPPHFPEYMTVSPLTDLVPLAKTYAPAALAARSQQRWKLSMGPGAGPERTAQLEISRPLRLFVSYAATDREHAAELRKHLHALQQLGLVATQAEILPGQDLSDFESAQLAEADAVAILLSADFFAEDRCYRHLQQALVRRAQADIPVVPIRLRAVQWETTQLGRLQALPPEPALPIAEQLSSDAAWKSVVDQLGLLLRSQV